MGKSGHKFTIVACALLFIQLLMFKPFAHVSVRYGISEKPATDTLLPLIQINRRLVAGTVSRGWVAGLHVLFADVVKK